MQWTVFPGEGDIDGADCFGASFEEYRTLLNKNYDIADILTCHVTLQKLLPLKRLFKKLRRHGVAGLRRVKERQIFVFVVKHRGA